MKFTLLFLSCLFFYPSAQAQSQHPGPSVKASVAAQVSNGRFGGIAEVFVKPKISAWASFTYDQIDRQLSFGEDTSSSAFFVLPAETVDYQGVQQYFGVRMGLRFYEHTNKEQWSFWYSPVLGYSNYSAPSDEFSQAFEREDLNDLFSQFNQLKAERYLELGGELGIRWAFWRKLYLESSPIIVGSQSLLKSGSNKPNVGFELRGALGIIF